MYAARFLGPYDDRVAAQLPEGYVVGACLGECGIRYDTVITGVERRTGEQQWLDGGGNRLTVVVEDFDLSEEELRNWATGVE